MACQATLVKDYYAHARALGEFTASQCLDLARQAAKMDIDGMPIIPAAITSREVLHDGSDPVTLSFGIKVY